MIVFIRGIDEYLVIAEERFALESTKSTHAGQELFKCVVGGVEKCLFME